LTTFIVRRTDKSPHFVEAHSFMICGDGTLYFYDQPEKVPDPYALTGEGNRYPSVAAFAPGQGSSCCKKETEL